MDSRRNDSAARRLGMASSALSPAARFWGGSLLVEPHARASQLPKLPAGEPGFRGLQSFVVRKCLGAYRAVAWRRVTVGLGRVAWLAGPYFVVEEDHVVSEFQGQGDHPSPGHDMVIGRPWPLAAVVARHPAAVSMAKNHELIIVRGGAGTSKLPGSPWLPAAVDVRGLDHEQSDQRPGKGVSGMTNVPRRMPETRSAEISGCSRGAAASGAVRRR